MAAVRHNGIPVIMTTEPAAYAYDPDVYEWVPIATGWYLASSPLTEKRTRNKVPADMPLAVIESALMDVWHGGAAGVERPKWWNEALTMGHYENRMRASVLIASEKEYKASLLSYARYLGEEDFRGRAEELVKDLVGPLYA
jgi:protein HIRA/HIR1